MRPANDNQPVPVPDREGAPLAELLAAFATDDHAAMQAWLREYHAAAPCAGEGCPPGPAADAACGEVPEVPRRARRCAGSTAARRS
jgi:hypothetical protein